MSGNSFLLDTNVQSELIREPSDRQVIDWFARHEQTAMHISSVTQAEILTGIALLPAGKRRVALATATEHMFEQDFASRCHGFDTAAAKNYALIVAIKVRQGQPISTENAQIAAIALAGGLILATRNTKDFENIEGLAVVNPWQSHLIFSGNCFLRMLYMRKKLLIQ